MPNKKTDLLEKIKQQAIKAERHIVLPDALDDRTIAAARKITNLKIAKITLIGNKNEISKIAANVNVKLDNIDIEDPEKSKLKDQFVDTFYQLRRGKVYSKEEVLNTVINPLYFGALMVKEGLADGSVAGSLSTTGDVLRAGIQAIGLADGIDTVSSFFLIIFPDKVYSFADGAVVPDPTADQLADIAVTTAENHRKLTGEKARVAMLSFSTKGSASHPMVNKVVSATKLARKKKPGMIIDGELQLDTAIVPEVSKVKSPESPLKGDANVLIFPNLDAGNIGYKMAQRMAGADALGPLVQGLNKPAFDLSRGCSVEDIIHVTAINAVMGYTK